MQWNTVIRVLWILVFSGILVIGALAAQRYSGTAWIYVVFTLLSSTVLFLGFGPRALFFDAFLGVLLWIGFWLKFSVRTAFFEGKYAIAIGAFDSSPASLDHALLVVCCALAAILAMRLIRPYFFSYPRALPAIAHLGLFEFYRRYRTGVLVSFVLAILVVSISNAWLGIYQRGQVPRLHLPLGLNGVYAWLLMFGLATGSAIILRFEFELNRHRYWIALSIALLETALSNISLWSRGMILNGSALLYGIVALMRRSEATPPWRLAVVAGLGFALFFMGSVLTVNYLRATTFFEKPPAVQQEVVLKQTSVLFLDRWVGIEGVMSVVGAPDRGWPLFKEALGERFDHDVNSFYDQRLIESSYDNAKHDGLHFISLPGYIAFLYYPGSYLFLFVAVFCFSALAAALEYFVYWAGGRNLVLCALIAQVIAFRYTSFGYVPMQSYMLLGSIVLNLLILLSFDRILRFYYKK